MANDNIRTERAKPLEMRQALELVSTFSQAGIAFLPVPVLNDEDRDRLLLGVHARLAKIEAAASAQEKVAP